MIRALNKLKKLEKKDLDEISNFLSLKIENLIFSRIRPKEIDDMDISISLVYDNGKLDVDISLELFVDELSEKDPRIIDKVLEQTYEKLESLLDKKYRITSPL